MSTLQLISTIGFGVSIYILLLDVHYQHKKIDRLAQEVKALRKQLEVKP
jgi:hypothetical protein